jgi:hypothetical protein
MMNALIKPGEVKPNDVEQRFTASANLSAAQCLAIYQRGYILRLTKCLAEQFPALCHALGKQLFDQFAQKYLQSSPSDSYTLYELGRRFPDFLEQDRPDKNLPVEARESWIDFMIDLAKYEQLHFKLFDAPGHEGNPWPARDVSDDKLIVQPCFAQASYRYPVAWYYHTIKENPKAAFPPLQTSYVTLLRKDYHVTTFPINRVHYQFLKQLQSCGSVCESIKFVSEVNQTPLDLVEHSWRNEVRNRWIEAGFFIEK